MENWNTEPPLRLNANAQAFIPSPPKPTPNTSTITPTCTETATCFAKSKLETIPESPSITAIQHKHHKSFTPITNINNTIKHTQTQTHITTATPTATPYQMSLPPSQLALIPAMDQNGLLVMIPQSLATPGSMFTPIINVSQPTQQTTQLNNNNNVDLAILCDITDGMKPWFDEIKNGIVRIVNQLKNTYGIGKLRLSFIGYRDWDDDNNNKGEKRIEKLKFTCDILEFESFIKCIKCIGGDDAAEDVLGGISESISGILWEAPIRILYHICDAPPHGICYHNYFEELQKQQEQQYINKINEMAFLDGDSDDSDSDIYNRSDKESKEKEIKLLKDEYDKWPNKYKSDPKHEDLFLEIKKKNKNQKKCGIKKRTCHGVWKHNISVIDTPGILDSNNNDRHHSNNLIEFLRGCGGVNAFLLVKTRYPPRFDSSFQNVLSSLEVMLGKEFWKHVILLITHTKDEDAVPCAFNKYANSLRENIYHQMNFKSCDGLLKCIGADSFKNYKKPIKNLIDIIPKQNMLVLVHLDKKDYKL